MKLSVHASSSLDHTETKVDVGADVRDATTADADGIRELYACSAFDFGPLLTRWCFRADPLETVRARHHDASFLVAVGPDGRIIGAGWAGMHDVIIDSARRRAAFFEGVVVHRDHRNRGVGALINRARYAWATSRAEDPLLYNYVAHKSSGQRAGERWLTSSRRDVLLASVRAGKKRPAAWEIRRAEEKDLDAIVAGESEFHRGHAAHLACTAEDLAHYLRGGLWSYHVAVDRSGNLVAGFALFREYEAMELATGLDLPGWMPKSWHDASFKQRRGVACRVWEKPGAGEALVYTLESVHRELEGARSIAVVLDPRAAELMSSGPRLTKGCAKLELLARFGGSFRADRPVALQGQ